MNDIGSIRNPNDTSSIFLEKPHTMYDKYFPLKKMKLKTKDLKRPLTTAIVKKVFKTEATAFYKVLEKQKPKRQDRM